jgi:hypothetical protein
MADLNDKSQPTDQSSEDLTVDYANNTFFEPTIWDLKLLFGEWSGRTNTIEWHTSITVPWAQAKLMAYYLSLNVAAHELKHGRVKVPDTMIPNDPNTLPQPPGEDAATHEAFLRLVTEHRKRFIESLK